MPKTCPRCGRPPWSDQLLEALTRGDERMETFEERLEAVERSLARLKATPGEVVEFQQPDGGVIRLIYDLPREEGTNG